MNSKTVTFTHIYIYSHAGCFRIPLASDSEDSGADEMAEEVEQISQNHQDYISGRYSPVLMKASELEADTIVYNPADDMRRLEYARSQVLKTGIKVDMLSVLCNLCN